MRDFAAETKAKEEQGRRVYYFAPGVHEIGELEVESHSTVTVDAGFDANSVVNKTLVGGVYLSGKGSSKTYAANKMSVSGDKIFVS